MTSVTPMQVAGSILFAVALIHTFSVGYFEKLAHRHPTHAGVLHMLGEVEIVFGFWAMVLVAVIAIALGPTAAVAYVDSRNFTEPLFVFAIMVVAASRPILRLALAGVAVTARAIPAHKSLATYFVALSLVPLLGSFITEPAAMTLAAFLLRDRFYAAGLSTRLKYGALGVLFVNVSIGGTLTSYAAPPVLMVAEAWGWDSAFMLTHFGWRSAVAVCINALGATLLFSRELRRLRMGGDIEGEPIPLALTFVHLACLVGVVLAAHHPAIFIGIFLFFLGTVNAYKRWQDRLILREGLLVGFFLAGLVVLGGYQQWWLQPVLSSMSPTAVYYGATALTAITDNAALTYLGSLVGGLTEEFKYALVAGAVTGGGLTVIANAPNPAGYSILKDRFERAEISASGLFAAAAVPTLVAIAAFRLV
ncbi:MAG: putative Na+/H+ antiporter, partial [Gammaproteobacteria bacterium]